MRPLELVVLLALAVRAGRAVRRPAEGERSGVPLDAAAVLALSVLAQVALEGVRWTLAPLHGLALAWVGHDLLRAARGRPAAVPGRGPRVGAAVGLTLLLLAAAAPSWSFPVPQLPAPTGPHAVGSDAVTVDVRLPADARPPAAVSPTDAAPPSATDASTGSQTVTPTDAPRRVRARLWYPAADATDARAGGATCDRRWLEHPGAMLPALAERGGLPAWAMSHLRFARVHACWGAPLADVGALPVVTLDHGRGGFAAQTTYLAEELASHGWLVVAPEHPGGAVATVVDGALVPFDPVAFGAGREGAAYRDAIRTLGRRWVADLRAVLDALEAGAGPPGVRDRLARDVLVTAGHSTGGGAAFGACTAEPGCRAAVGLDPWMLPTPATLLGPATSAGGLEAEVLAVFSDPARGFFEPTNREAFDGLAEATRARGYAVRAIELRGAGHNDVTDVPRLSPFAGALGLYVGPAPADVVHARVRGEVVAVLERARARDDVASSR